MCLFFVIFEKKSKENNAKSNLSSGLPVQVRDAALQVAESMPKTDINKEYFAQNAEAMVGRRINNFQLKERQNNK